MWRKRAIPCLLLRGQGLVKTKRFKNPRYVGDPVNAVRIFNDKEVDELVIVDIDATRESRGPNLRLIREIASECFMPVAYGGGIRTVEDIRAVLAQGIEKVIINSAAAANPALIREAATEFGSQSIIVSIDARKKLLGGYEVRTCGGRHATRREPVEYAAEAARLGAGEILLTAIDREGTGSGYDIDLVRQVASAVKVPLIAHGGAGSLADFTAAVRLGGASAVAAGSLFVFHGRHQAVLISYPSVSDLEKALS